MVQQSEYGGSVCTLETHCIMASIFATLNVNIIGTRLRTVDRLFTRTGGKKSTYQQWTEFLRQVLGTNNDHLHRELKLHGAIAVA